MCSVHPTLPAASAFSKFLKTHFSTSGWFVTNCMFAGLYSKESKDFLEGMFRAGESYTYYANLLTET